MPRGLIKNGLEISRISARQKAGCASYIGFTSRAVIVWSMSQRMKAALVWSYSHLLCPLA